MYLYLHKNSYTYTWHTSAPHGVLLKKEQTSRAPLLPIELTSCIISTRMIMRIAHEEDVIFGKLTARSPE